MYSKIMTMTSTEDYLKNIKQLKEAIAESDAVVIGAGAGLSTSAGFIYTGDRLQKYFGDFVSKYNIQDMYSGGFMVMQLPREAFWAYWSRYIYINRYMNPPKPVYEKLFELVKDKDYFVITTNVDHCFQKAGFDKKRLFYTQGDYGLFQCSKPCHNKTYDNEDTIRKMLLAQGFSFTEDGTLFIPEDATLKMEIPSALIPTCPICGEPMVMNLRADDSFAEDEGWHNAAERYQNFLRTRKGKVLLLELGVGYNTPVIIKYPFWQMTANNPDATYACVNYGDTYAPEEIKYKSIVINGDIGDILDQLEE